jgi:CHAT domain-containing protein/tetratricopeptide (TPR) repeat protein
MALRVKLLFTLSAFGLGLGLLALEVIPWDAHSGVAPGDPSRAGACVVRPDGRGDFPTIQTAVDAQEPGGVILLADGRFTGPGNRDIALGEKSLTLGSLGGVPDRCVIDCQGSAGEPHRGFVMRGTDAATVTIQGIEICNGYAEQGGGAECHGVSPAFHNCVFTNNHAARVGGAVVIANDTDPAFRNCVFSANHAGLSGGGIYSCHAFPRMSGCIFADNACTDAGSAVYLSVGRADDTGRGKLAEREIDRFPAHIESYPEITDCTFSGNQGNGSAGVICLVYCSPRIANTSIVNNSGPAIMQNSFSYPALLGCNIHGNSGGDWTGFVGEQLGINGNESEPPREGSRRWLPWLATTDPGSAARSAGEPEPCSSSIAERKRLWDNRELLIELKNRAWFREIRGNYAEAEALFRELLATHRRLLSGDHPRIATSLEDLAYVLYERGDYAEAEDLYREALAMRRALGPCNQIDMAVSLTKLAMLLEKIGKSDEAEALLREALCLHGPGTEGDSLQVAKALDNLALVLLDRGDLIGAEGQLRRVLGIYERDHVDWSTDLAWVRHHLGRTLVRRQETAEAESLYRGALDSRLDRFGREHPLVAQSLLSLGDCRLLLGDDTGAEAYYRQSAAIFETVRATVGPGTSRATFMESPYVRLASVLLLQGKQAEAWVAIEKARGRVMADLLTAADRRAQGPEPMSGADSLERTLGELEGQLRALEGAQATDRNLVGAELSEVVAKKREETRTRLLETQAAWSLATQDVGTRAGTPGEHTFDLPRIQSALDSRTAVLGWLDFDLESQMNVCAGYVIRADGPVVWETLDAGPSRPPGLRPEFCSAFRDSLMIPRAPYTPFRGDGALADAARQLCEAWIDPLLPHLEGIDRLIVVPSGPMLGVPIEAGRDASGRYLGERFSICYAPSVTTFTWLREEARSRPGNPAPTALLLGDPPFAPHHLQAMLASSHSGDAASSGSTDQAPSDSGADEFGPSPSESFLRSALAGDCGALSLLPRLAWTEAEITHLKKLLPGSTVLLGPDASESAILELAHADQLRRFDILHLATHALISDERPERSALVLSQVSNGDPLQAALAGQPVVDGLLTADEIVRELHLDADLVTLSACQTALGRTVPGEGYFGLASAFLQAGTRSLVVSLWRVSDRATARLMARFYEYLTGAAAPPGDPHGVGVGAEIPGRRMSKTRALQLAKEWLRDYRAPDGRREFEHPAFWAGFVLIGDPGE